MAHAQRDNQHQDRQVHATGGASHFAAVPPDRNAEPVREFPRFTVDINAIADGQWLQQLMAYGLLCGAFHPADRVCVLRSLWRQLVYTMLVKGEERYRERGLRQPSQRAQKLAWNASPPNSTP